MGRGSFKSIKEDDEVATLYLDPIESNQQIDELTKVDVHGTFSDKRPWLDKIPCMWDS